MPRPRPLVRNVSMPIRVPPRMRGELNALAASQGRTLNDLCTEVLEHALRPAGQIGSARTPAAMAPSSFGVGSPVEVLEIFQFGPDKWHLAIVAEIRPGADSFVARFTSSKPRSAGDAEEIALHFNERGRCWR